MKHLFTGNPLKGAYDLHTHMHDVHSIFPIATDGNKKKSDDSNALLIYEGV